MPNMKIKLEIDGDDFTFNDMAMFAAWLIVGVITEWRGWIFIAFSIIAGLFLMFGSIEFKVGNQKANKHNDGTDKTTPNL